MSAELRIVPAKKFVRIEFKPAHTKQEMLKLFEEETKKKEDNQFVEGLVYSSDEAVIMTANMTDDAEPGKVRRGRWVGGGGGRGGGHGGVWGERCRGGGRWGKVHEKVSF